VSKKSPKIVALLAAHPGDPRHSPHYTGYFHCFNLRLYYEAHDVLEELWLVDRKAPDGNFFKGLIQLAGAYVHLQKNRLKPASNLFRLAETNLAAYPPVHYDLDLAAILALCRAMIATLAASAWTVNPWSPEAAPFLRLNPA